MQETRFQPLHQREHLDWPFFDAEHRDFMRSIDSFTSSGALNNIKLDDVDTACRRLVKALGQAGILRICVPASHGGIATEIESRRITLAREGLAYHSGLADFSLAMQGLGSGAISLEGSDELKQDVLPKVMRGTLIPAFALSEKEAGSDVSAMTTTARLENDEYVINGEKTWISNGGIADIYTLFARTGDESNPHHISAFIVYPDDPGFEIAERLDVMAPHPLATLRFTDMRIPASRLLGKAGEGFKLAMRTLDIFRVSVAGAALGFARRALDEGVLHARTRNMFGATLADLQLTQGSLADMMAWMDSATLMTYRAAWRRDVQKLNTTQEAALAKMVATENAQRIVDTAQQLFGARGVQVGQIMESLYREIRALRIYEGATEIQKIIVARTLLKNAAGGVKTK